MRRAIAVLPEGTWCETEPVATATLSFDQRHRRRVRMLDDAGEPFLLDLERPVTLADGDGLGLAGGGVIRVRAAEEAVIEAHGATTADAARLAWHLGNRHAPVQVLAAARCGCATIRCWRRCCAASARASSTAARRSRPSRAPTPTPGVPATSIITAPATMRTHVEAGLARLLTWLSPAFPIGGYSYSHGLEYAVEAGLVANSTDLRAWIESVLRHGAGRTDAILFGAAWRAERHRDNQRLGEVLAWGQAFRGPAELARESSAQGRAFVDAVRAAWPHPRLDAFDALARQLDRTPTLPVAVGVACAVVGIGEASARLACLQAFAANLVSAGIRLIPLGQSEGLRVLAGLEEPAWKRRCEPLPRSRPDSVSPISAPPPGWSTGA